DECGSALLPVPVFTAPQTSGSPPVLLAGPAPAVRRSAIAHARRPGSPHRHSTTAAAGASAPRKGKPSGTAADGAAHVRPGRVGCVAVTAAPGRSLASASRSMLPFTGLDLGLFLLGGLGALLTGSAMRRALSD